MSVQERLKGRITEAVKELFDMELGGLAVEIPPRIELGDLAFPVAFELAGRLKAITGKKHNPREIASRIAAKLGDMPGVARVEVAGAGYINIYLDRAEHLIDQLSNPAQPKPAFGGKIIVEHTSVNPNKAAHIGHLRNAILGDAIVRLLRAMGENVEVQNYIDNTGVQVADVVVGFKYLEKKTLEEIKAIHGRFDYYCWDLYARVGQFYEEDLSRLKLRSRTLEEIESGSGETFQMADYISTRILNCHLDTMFRVGIEYDLLPRESDVLRLHIWDHAFELLKRHGAIEYETEGRLAGCWVMRAAEDQSQDQEHEADKVIVRSNGTVTYTGKDIAFHLWKLGQIPLDFYYKPFRSYPSGRTAWITTSNPEENDPSHPPFGRGSVYFNVIDASQSYPQHYVKLACMAVDEDRRVDRSAHLAYEKVVLSPEAARALGQSVSEEELEKKAIHMSGRRGLGVKADDLIDQLEESALEEVTSRHPDLSPEEQRQIAHKIAVGALRYFLLKYTRNSIISFDFKEALAFEGETGPYIQYSIVRANSIFRKLEEADIATPGIESFPRERVNQLLGEELWELCYFATQFGQVIRSAALALEPAHLAKWAFQLAQKFNLFYHKHHILSEPDQARRALLIAITQLVRGRLVAALELLGIEAPERM
jgi:arginyl-tRNA synthetase